MNKKLALELLGVDDKADNAALKKAYRKAAQKHHPDKGGSEAKFKEVKEAYEFLTNPQPEYVGRTNNGGASFEEMFKSAFSRFNGGQEHAAGFQHFVQPERYETIIRISLQDAFSGTSRNIKLGVFASAHDETIVIPAGVRHGQVVKQLVGQSKQNDKVEAHVAVVVAIEVPPGITMLQEDIYRSGNEPRQAGDLIIPTHISPFLMMVGGQYEYTTIDGKNLSVRVPAGLEANKKLKIKGMGYWRDQRCHSRGDVYLIAIPIIKKLGEYPARHIAEFVDEISKFYPEPKPIDETPSKT